MMLRRIMLALLVLLLLFLVAAGLVLTIAMFTISYQAIKVASMNPVKSLRYE